jgi:hypothetical protein
MSAIGVAQACFDRICNQLSSSNRIDYQFDGDTFSTQIWREDGKIMAEDPKGIREIIVLNPDTMLNGKAGSLKGIFAQLLLRKGFDYEVVISLLCQIKPELDRLDHALHNHDKVDLNAATDAKRHASQLFRTLVAVCEKHKEGGAIVSVSHENFSAFLL